ncbi:hypothetical protein [Paludisphaera soli]|uniref:hypothetical protein n=1 Tax=Paludisphaera soli TaxID=2712865 RepID=UPI0013ECEC06|nr:hypothetical protein [Paludisphaera soli]
MRKSTFIAVLLSGCLAASAGCGGDPDDPAAFQNNQQEVQKAAERGKEIMKGARKKPSNIPKNPLDEPG